MTKECKWVIKEASDAEKVERLSTEVGIDKVLADLLVTRGIATHSLCAIWTRQWKDCTRPS